MEADDRRLSGRIIDGDDVEAAGAFADAAFRKEVAGGASEEMLFAGRDAELRQGGHFVADSAGADSTKARVSPS